jgi:hypothetical protein
VCRAFTLILVVSDSSSLAASAGYRALISSASLVNFSSVYFFLFQCFSQEMPAFVSGDVE